MIEYLIIKYDDGIDRLSEIHQMLESRKGIPYEKFGSELQRRFGSQPPILAKISEPRKVREMMIEGFLAYDVIDGIVQSQCSAGQSTIQ
ncbi:hypothetical protein HYY70_05785 [Candidatus Woesearchaeota archaeon]|nr:hypothetical protein [Candidatus Woesearchaeota archaeon]